MAPPPRLRPRPSPAATAAAGRGGRWCVTASSSLQGREGGGGGVSGARPGSRPGSGSVLADGAHLAPRSDSSQTAAVFSRRGRPPRCGAAAAPPRSAPGGTPGGGRNPEQQSEEPGAPGNPRSTRTVLSTVNLQLQFFPETQRLVPTTAELAGDSTKFIKHFDHLVKG